MTSRSRLQLCFLSCISAFCACCSSKSGDDSLGMSPTNLCVATMMDANHQITGRWFYKRLEVNGTLAPSLVDVVHELESLKRDNFPPGQLRAFGGRIYDGCPHDFQTAFDDYINAWKRAVVVAQQFPDSTYEDWLRATALPKDPKLSEMHKMIQSTCTGIEGAMKLLERQSWASGVNINELRTKRPYPFRDRR